MPENILTTQDLINDLVEKNLCGKKVEAKQILDYLWSTIMDHLKRGNKIKTPIGSFSVVTTPARIGVNPKTGDKIDIPAKERIKFTASANAKRAIN